MSAVINKAKLHYLSALKIEFFLLVSLFGVLMIWKGVESVSFLGGFLSGFLPHCVFVYWIFFKKTTKNQSKMGDFYRGEGLKWIITILLVVMCFKLLPYLHLVLFFVGYLMALFLNNVIPFILSKRTH
ncbi:MULTISPECIES: ATP synthase subunit I [Actinobacillus]|uniref:F0F1 ATP synthase subunit I n=1 Tax=Actinobacillus lignieresii TaxID=720 RepID=A0A380U3S3_ACTLI|nr:MULTISPECIES: ATP synthase subunit I [Actinobacillus]WGE35651.1 ATP synthase subunit I [Actinobacillus genomosp. 1]SUT95235.1 F0F1 ATP synthase subunit I [Actinobacillus lignieresii]VEB27235.1 F0F1 ATP synthase subunit I [Actinobacillus lignieresii]